MCHQQRPRHLLILQLAHRKNSDQKSLEYIANYTQSDARINKNGKGTEIQYRTTIGQPTKGNLDLIESDDVSITGVYDE